jgi:hypothetical protein
VEARDALPRLARRLEDRHGVNFRWGVAAFAPALAQRVKLRDCKLQMMRIASPHANFRLPSVVMTDLSLLRYEGFATQPSAAALRERLTRECPAALSNGVHLIVA